MKRKFVLELICFLFILLLVYAAFSKLLNYERFRIQVVQSPLLTGVGDWLPAFVLFVEFAVSILLVIPSLRLLGLFGAFTLMVMFTTYVIAIIHFSPYVPCTCGGILERMNWQDHLLFNSVFVVLGFVGIVFQAREELSVTNLRSL